MNAERWQHIKTIAYSALLLPEPERATYITNACEGNEQLRKEIDQLLEAIAESEETKFMAQPAFDSDKFISDLSDKWQSVSSHKELIGEQIGPYRITKQLGSGGMGSVFKGERTDGQFHQQVAIKLIRKGVDTEENIQRFRMEQEILARLHHPHISQLYDGGITQDGTPYLVMEFMDGIPIDKYCNKHRLTIGERIELFNDVCSAVQYAHSNLVIHRDLKTKNIYVTPEKVVKVLDFGVAKLLSPELTEITLLETRPGQKLWTPQYAAPEQVQGEAITIATDVYALGVLLHKLLTDTYPLNLSGKEIQEIERMIIETSPIAPSQSVTVNSEKETAKNRSTSPSELKKLLSGDLDALVLKALRKEPEYRYHAVSQLQDDIERYQKGLPLIARADTVRYRMGKFFRRHKAAIAAASLFLILAISAVTFYTRKITKERDRAEQVTQFLTTLFNQSDPMQARGDSVTVRQVLDAGAERVKVELAGQPDLQAKMQSVIGQVYYQLAIYNKAEELLESARQKQEQFSGSRAEADLAKTLMLLADINHKFSRFNEAEELGRKALALFEKSKGEASAETQNMLMQLSIMLHTHGKFHEAALLTQRWIKSYETRPTQKSADLANQLQMMGQSKLIAGDNEQAELFLRQSLMIRTELFGENHPKVAVALERLSGPLFKKGNYREAEQLRRRALEINRKVYPENHPELAWSLKSLASILAYRGRYEKADLLYQESIQRFILLTDENSSTAKHTQFYYAKFLIEAHQFKKAQELLDNLFQYFYDNYGELYLFTIHSKELMAEVQTGLKHLNEARKLFEEVLDQYSAKYGDKHVRSLNARQGYGLVLILMGEAEEGEKWIREALEFYQQSKNAVHQNRGLPIAKNMLGLCLGKQGYFREAEVLLLESYQTINKHRGPKSNVTKTVLKNLISLYEDWDKPVQGENYKNILASGE